MLRACVCRPIRARRPAPPATCRPRCLFLPRARQALLDQRSCMHRLLRCRGFARLLPGLGSRTPYKDRVAPLDVVVRERARRAVVENQFDAVVARGRQQALETAFAFDVWLGLDLDALTDY